MNRAQRKHAPGYPWARLPGQVTPCRRRRRGGAGWAGPSAGIPLPARCFAEPKMQPPWKQEKAKSGKGWMMGAGRVESMRASLILTDCCVPLLNTDLHTKTAIGGQMKKRPISVPKPHCTHFSTRSTHSKTACNIDQGVGNLFPQRGCRCLVWPLNQPIPAVLGTYCWEPLFYYWLNMRSCQKPALALRGTGSPARL